MTSYIHCFGKIYLPTTGTKFSLRQRIPLPQILFLASFLIATGRGFFVKKIIHNMTLLSSRLYKESHSSLKIGMDQLMHLQTKIQAITWLTKHQWTNLILGQFIQFISTVFLPLQYSTSELSRHLNTFLNHLTSAAALV